MRNKKEKPANRTAVEVSSGGIPARGKLVRTYTMQRTDQADWLNNHKNDAEYVPPVPADGGTAKTEPAAKDRVKAEKLLKTLGICAIVLVALLPLVFAALFLKVSSFELRGDCKYSAEELAAAAGISSGDRLAGILSFGASKAVTSRLPDIKSCKIRINLNGTVSFEAEEYVPVLYFGLAGRYYSATSEMYIIESADSADAFSESGLLRISAPMGSVAVEGSQFVARDGGCEYIGEFLKAASESGIGVDFEYVDFSNPYGITAETDDGTSVRFGSVGDITEKFALAKSVITNKENGKKTVIDVSTPGVASVKSDS